MSRLLKDCMNPCCCKKDENICDIIDDLGKFVENVDCKKKVSKEIAKEIDKAVKKVTEETDEKFKEVIEEWTALLKEFDSKKWVIGEYKWMPVGSKMPKGWVKVELAKGLTLIQGDEKGTTTGSLKAHYHNLYDNANAWGVEQGGVLYFADRPEGAGISGENMVFTKDNSKATFITKTATVGTPNNLAAGIYAELWQFKGVNYVKNCVKKCLESSIAESIDKCLEDMDKCKKVTVK